MDKNTGFDAEHIARNLIFDGRLTDAELSECCELPPERVHELIVESALALREQMLELREMLIAMRRPDATDEERRRSVIDVVLQLKLTILSHFYGIWILTAFLGYCIHWIRMQPILKFCMRAKVL